MEGAALRRAPGRAAAVFQQPASTARASPRAPSPTSGTYNVGTHSHARRLGLGTALIARLAHVALVRGSTTTSLQSTPTAERVYTAVGFRDLGRILKLAPFTYTPGSGSLRG